MSGKVINRTEELVAKRRQADPHFPSSHRQIAKSVGMTPNTVGQWMNNHVQRYDADKLAAWCDFLEVEIGDLLVYVRDEK